MARVELLSFSDGVIQTSLGQAVTGALVKVYTHGTTAPVTIYADEFSGSTLTQDATFITDSKGRIPGWVTESQRLDILCQGITTPLEAFSGSPTPGVAANWRGVYAGGSTYALNDAVDDGTGGLFISNVNGNIGNAPDTHNTGNGSGTQWTPLSASGASTFFCRALGAADIANIQGVLDAAKTWASGQANRVKATVVLASGRYVCSGSTGITRDCHFVSVIAYGAVLDGSSFSGATFWTDTGTLDGPDGNQSWGDAVTSLEGVQLIGPAANTGGGSSSGPTALLLGTGGVGNLGPAHTSYNKLTIRGWGIGVKYGSNGYLNSFYNCDIFNNYIGVDSPFGLSNGGEGIRFIGGALFANCFDVLNSNPGADMHFLGVSFDFTIDSGNPSGNPQNPRSRKIAVFKGRVFCTDCHFEDSQDIDWWWTVNDPTASLIITNSDFTISNDKGAYELGLSMNDPTLPAESSGFGGITIRDCHIGGTNCNYGLPTLIAGRGRAVVENLHNELGAITAGLGVNKSPYAPGSRYRSQVDGSFGIGLTQFTCTTDSTTFIGTITGGLVATTPSVGAQVYAPGVYAAGTVVTAAAGASYTTSNKPLVTGGGKFVYFDSTDASIAQALAQWTDESSTGADSPTVDTTTRATSPDGLAFNAFKVQVGTGGNTSGRYRLIACSPGQVFCGSAQLDLNQLVANADQLALKFTFLDRNGVAVGQPTAYSFPPAWVASIYYTAGSVVSHGGSFYQANVDFLEVGTFTTANFNLLGSSTGGYYTVKIFPVGVPLWAVAMKFEILGSAWHTGSQAWVADLNLDFDGPAQPTAALQSSDLASAKATANQTGIGTGATDLTNLTVTFTAPPSGKVMLSGFITSMQQLVAAGTPQVQITDSSNTVQQVCNIGSVAINAFSATLFLQARLSGLTPGTSYTYKMRAFTSGSSATTTLVATATQPATLQATAL